MPINSRVSESSPVPSILWRPPPPIEAREVRGVKQRDHDLDQTGDVLGPADNTLLAVVNDVVRLADICGDMRPRPPEPSAPVDHGQRGPATLAGRAVAADKTTNM